MLRVAIADRVADTFLARPVCIVRNRKTGYPGR